MTSSAQLAYSTTETEPKLASKEAGRATHARDLFNSTTSFIAMATGYVKSAAAAQATAFRRLREGEPGNY